MNIDHFNDEENFNDYKVWYFSVPSFVYGPDLLTRRIPVPMLFPGFWTKTDLLYLPLRKPLKPNPSTRAGIPAYICLLVGIRHICLCSGYSTYQALSPEPGSTYMFNIAVLEYDPLKNQENLVIPL